MDHTPTSDWYQVTPKKQANISLVINPEIFIHCIQYVSSRQTIDPLVHGICVRGLAKCLMNLLEQSSETITLRPLMYMPIQEYGGVEAA